jgi:hypothetical protein
MALDDLASPGLTVVVTFHSDMKQAKEDFKAMPIQDIEGVRELRNVLNELLEGEK